MTQRFQPHSVFGAPDICNANVMTSVAVMCIKFQKTKKLLWRVEYDNISSIVRDSLGQIVLIHDEVGQERGITLFSSSKSITSVNRTISANGDSEVLDLLYDLLVQYLQDSKKNLDSYFDD